MLDEANGGAFPPAGILRAIRHGVAAGACRAAARETSETHWARLADQHHRLVGQALSHAAVLRLPSEAAPYTSGRN